MEMVFIKWLLERMQKKPRAVIVNNTIRGWVEWNQNVLQRWDISQAATEDLYHQEYAYEYGRQFVLPVPRC